MMNAIAVTVFGIVFFIGTRPVHGQVKPEADAYAAVFELQFHGIPASMMAVKDVAVAMPTLSGTSAEWLAQFDDVPAHLRRAATQNVPTKATPFDVALFPVGIKVVSEESIERIFAGGVEQGWTVFRQQHASGLLSLSEFIFTPDSLDALVYYEARCGSLCGESSYLWLHRSTAQSRWAIAKRIIRSMS